MVKPCKILVVDDEPLLKSLVFQKFKAQINAGQYEFFFASNGLEALDKVNADPELGVILTDIKMPQMDGLTLMQHLALQDRFFKIIVITAYGDIINIRKAMDAGAADFILKPFDMKDFETSLMNIVNQYQFVKEGMRAKDKMIALSKEFEIAKEIKKSFIPVNFKPFPTDRVSMMGEMLSSHSLGGDFFDFFPFSEEELGVVIANLVGKGVPAALYTAIIQMLGRAVGLTCENPHECTNEIHAFLMKEIPSKAIKGLFYGVFNMQTGDLSYCTSGEVIAYLLSSAKKLDPLTNCKQIKLHKGEKIFITTKELVTSRNNALVPFGQDKLEEVLNGSFPLTCQETIHTVKENFTNFTFSKEPEADIPLFCLQSNFG